MYRKDAEDRVLKMYITDSLKIIAENIAATYGGKTIRQRYAEIVNPKPQDDRNADEIIAAIKSKLKGDELA